MPDPDNMNKSEYESSKQMMSDDDEDDEEIDGIEDLSLDDD